MKPAGPGPGPAIGRLVVGLVLSALAYPPGSAATLGESCQSTLAIGTVGGEAGQSGVRVPVSISTSAALRGLQFEIRDAPNEATLVDCVSQLVDFDCSVADNGREGSVVFLSLGGAAIPPGQDRVVLDLEFDLDIDALEGTIELEAEGVQVADVDNQPCPADLVPGGIVVGMQCGAEVLVGDGAGEAGSANNEVSVLISNDTSVRGLQFELLSASDGIVLSGCESAVPDFDCSWAVDDMNVASIIVFSIGGALILPGVEQPMLRLSIDVADQVAPGSYPWSLQDLQVADDENGPCAAVGNAGTFEVVTAAKISVISNRVDDAEIEVTLPSRYTDPVVIAGPPTANGPQPGVVRVDAVQPSSFAVSFVEWLYLDGAHAEEDVSFLVGEAGRHTQDDGSVWEFGTFELSGTGAFRTVQFSTPFAGEPTLILTAQTANGGQPVVPRARNVSATGFEAAMFEEQQFMDGHLAETVGYVAVLGPRTSGVVELNGETYPYLRQFTDIDERPTAVLAWRVSLEEEASLDAEVDHINERIALIAIGDHLFAQDVSTNGWDTVALRRTDPRFGAPIEWGVVRDVTDRWTTLPVVRDYDNPVVVVGPASENGGDPGVLRVRPTEHRAIEVAFREWDYLDGSHAAETVFYMVVESGRHNLGGLLIEAGTLDTDATIHRAAGEWEQVQLGQRYLAPPAVFCSVQTFVGRQPVTCRVRDRTLSTFEATMQEEEGNDGSHVTETLGWVAMQVGTGTTSDQRLLQVFVGRADDQYTQNGFDGGFASRARVRVPVTVARLTSTIGADPADLRYRNLDLNGVEIIVEEEQSFDEEVGHALENLAIFVAE